MTDLETGTARPVKTYREYGLRTSNSPSIDTFEEDVTYRDSEMRSLDLAATVVGTIMALGPLTVFSIFGS